jgi:hypothetical protein
MSYLLVRHKLRNFEEWKRVYDGHEAARRKAGLTEKYLFRDAEDPTEVTLLFEASDDSKARAFATSDDLREAMKNAGVLGKPDIHLLRTAK